MLSYFTYRDGSWAGGEIYDSYSGKTYSSIIKLAKDKLIIRGYVGISIFGRSTTWARAK